MKIDPIPFHHQLPLMVDEGRITDLAAWAKSAVALVISARPDRSQFLTLVASNSHAAARKRRLAFETAWAATRRESIRTRQIRPDPTGPVYIQIAIYPETKP